MDERMTERVAWAICKHLRESPCLECPTEVETDYGPGVQMCRAHAEEVVCSVVIAMHETPSLSQFPDLDKREET